MRRAGEGKGGGEAELMAVFKTAGFNAHIQRKPQYDNHKQAVARSVIETMSLNARFIVGPVKILQGRHD